MYLKKWKLNDIDEQEANILASECGIPEFTSQILVGRGIKTPFDVDGFISQENFLEDPFKITDMDKAVDRIRDAIEKFELICVYGDYDCDGVCSTYILYSYLESMGANVTCHIPVRDEGGYGLNIETIKQLKEQEVNLIITVDNGISALDEADYCEKIGIDLIITDHHQVGNKLPTAIAVLNPHRLDCKSEFKYLCGAGVAFKLVTALEDGDYDTTLSCFSDIVAIATVGDIVPMIGENRTLVKYGLEMLKSTENLGLSELIKVGNINLEKINSTNIAFRIVPRINAAGRLQSAELGLNLLLCQDPELANELAVEIDNLNIKRQEIEKQILESIDKSINQNPDILNDKVLVFYGENWHHGVIGIVSSKILQKYGKPNILLCVDKDEAKGSARSINGYSLYKALTSCNEKLIKYGGHNLAAGLCLKTDDIEDFINDLRKYNNENFDNMPINTIYIDRQVSVEEINIENIKSLELLQPFGCENQIPLFLIKNCKLENINPISENKHIKLNFSLKEKTFNCVYFGVSTDDFLYKNGDILDIIVTLELSTYNDKTYQSIKIKDIRPSNFNENKFFNAKNYYEKFKRTNFIDKTLKSKVIPTREEIGIIYKILKSNNGYNSDIDNLYLILDQKINYCKLRIILDILNELNLIEMSKNLSNIKFLQVNQKVDLNNSKILSNLNEL